MNLLYKACWFYPAGFFIYLILSLVWFCVSYIFSSGGLPPDMPDGLLTDGEGEVLLDTLGHKRGQLLFQFNNPLALLTFDVRVRPLGSSALFRESSHRYWFPSPEPFTG